MASPLATLMVLPYQYGHGDDGRDVGHDVDDCEVGSDAGGPFRGQKTERALRCAGGDALYLQSCLCYEKGTENVSN